MKDKYRIVYRPSQDDPCCWQLQESTSILLFFTRWIELCNFSSATSAANEILLLIEENS